MGRGSRANDGPSKLFDRPPYREGSQYQSGLPRRKELLWNLQTFALSKKPYLPTCKVTDWEALLFLPYMRGLSFLYRNVNKLARLAIAVA